MRIREEKHMTDSDKLALQKLFERRTVVDMKMIAKAVKANSRSSIVQLLYSFDYITSYNNNCGFYALKSAPKYDENGLWEFNGALFSARISLSETVVHFVEKSEAGYKYKEICDALKVDLRNLLPKLAKKGQIEQMEYEGDFLYVSLDKSIMEKQLQKRKELKLPEVPNGDLDPAKAIAAINAYLKHPDFSVSALAKNIPNIAVSRDELEMFFKVNKIEVEKKLLI